MNPINMFQTNLDASMGRHERQAMEPLRGLLLDDDLLDDELDTDTYDDTRAEMRSTGHNVTSVLMNPRETLLEDLMDEFASEQSMVLETLHPILPVTAEVEECQRIILKLRALIGRRNKTLMNTMITRAPTKEDVETCFREVPSIFFRPVTSQTVMLKAEDLQEMLQFSGDDSPTAASLQRNANARTGPKPSGGQGHEKKSDDASNGERGVQSTNGSASKTRSSPVSIPALTNNSHSSSNSNNSGSAYPPIEAPGRAQQERLSQYLDLVEVALLKQIWSRSPAFFRASDDIRALQEQVKMAGHMISARRRDLQNIAAGLQSGAMRIPHLSTRAENQRKLLHKLSAMQKILDGRNAVESLMSVDDHLGALQVTTDTLAVYKRECSDIASLKSVGSQLQQYEDAIGQVMCDKLASMAMTWDDTDADCAQPMETLLKALLVVGKTEPALQLYTTRLLECIKIIVRSCVSEYLVHIDTELDLPSNSSGSGAGVSQGAIAAVMDDSPFSVRVKEMNSEAFFSCMEMCFEQLLQALRTADSVNIFIVDCLANSLSSGEEIKSEIGIHKGIKAVKESVVLEEYNQKIAETSRAIEISVTCIKSACDASQRYLSQFLVLRKDSCSAMTTEQMKQLWASVSAFVVSLEKLISSGGEVGAAALVASAPSGVTAQPHSSSAYTLRKTLLGIVKNFIDKVHDANKSKLVSTLDSERWAQCEVSAERQAKIGRLASGSMFLGDGIVQDVGAAAASSAPSEKQVMVDTQPFVTAWSALLLVEMLMDYIGFAAVFSGKVTEDSVIPKMTELLQLFDTHTHRLVLGAQATKAAAALKSISARHLAVTVQSIGMILALLPHARTALMGFLSGAAGGGSNSFLVELDRISNQYSEHQSKLLTKFVTIVGEAVDASSEKKLGNTDWDRFNGQCEYFEEIVRNVSALHRVLSSTLPPEQLQNVFTRIFMHLNRKIPLHFDDIKPSTQTGKQRILDEVSHLVLSFQQLPRINAAAVTLEETFRKKYMISK